MRATADHTGDRPEDWGAPGAALERSAASDQITAIARVVRRSHREQRSLAEPAHAELVELLGPPATTSRRQIGMWRSVKLWPNPYRDRRDRSTLWILFGVLVFVFLTCTAAVWVLHSALR